MRTNGGAGGAEETLGASLRERKVEVARLECEVALGWSARGCELRLGGGQCEVGEDAGDDDRVLDELDAVHSSLAAGTDENLVTEDPAEQLRPRASVRGGRRGG